VSCTIRSGATSAVVLPDSGARIVSLRGAGREWLLPSAPTPDRRPYAEFLHEGTGGWDEIAPTIQAHTRDDGYRIPDHGELWNTAWSVLEQTPSALTTQLIMHSTPVTITRRIAATDDGGLLFSYAAVTTQAAPFPFFWSAHPLFRAEGGSAITLPDGGDSTLLQEYPDERVIPWPRNGALSSVPVGTAMKAFGQKPHAHSRAALTHPDGSRLTFSWNSTALPYIGLFWDNSHFSPVPAIAIEPTTAQGDNPHVAEFRNPIRRISADAPLTWWLAVNIAP
jgi:galactose mutarotase-like enzyme